MGIRTITCLPVAALTLSLVACVAVPVDSRTGLPTHWTPRAAAQDSATGSAAPAVAPPALPATPVAQAYTARLYPLNAIANRAGPLTATVMDGGQGRGAFTLSYLGDALQGEATRVQPNHPGFGRIHQAVFGAGASARSYAGRLGIANAGGAKGVSAQCEYTLTGPNLGTGACVFSDGATYQLHFG